MKVAYINKDKVVQSSENELLLERMYMSDIRKQFNKKKSELIALGISETDFVTKIKEALAANRGL